MSTNITKTFTLFAPDTIKVIERTCGEVVTGDIKNVQAWMRRIESTWDDFYYCTEQVTDQEIVDFVNNREAAVERLASIPKLPEDHMDCNICPHHEPFALTPSSHCNNCGAVSYSHNEYDITFKEPNNTTFVKLYHARSTLEALSKAQVEFPDHTIIDIVEVEL